MNYRFNNYHETLTINNKEVPVSYDYLEVNELNFYPYNPRIYSLLNLNESVASQEEIQEKLLDMDHVKKLIQSIKSNKGIIDPIIVRDDTYEVLEGNSRLAAYKELFRLDPINWAKIKSKILPSYIDENDIFSLLGQYHIIGRKDWAPYEQAGYLFRRHKYQNISQKQISEELGLPYNKVRHKINVFSFMVEYNEDKHKWSYYDEYLKNKNIDQARREYTNMDSLVVDKIRNKEIYKAEDVRDKLTKIASSKKALKKFVNCTRNFEDCYSLALSKGADSSTLKKLRQFKTWISSNEIDNEISNMDNEIKNKCLYDIKRINRRTTKLLNSHKK